MSEFTARVIATAGSRCTVDSGAAEPATLSQRRNRAWVLCGDRVVLEEGVVARIAPRSSTFFRADRLGDKQPIAANIDIALIVVASEPPPTRDLIARYVIACADCGVKALLVVNKSDLFADENACQRWLAEETAASDIGIEVFAVSAFLPETLQRLRARIDGQVSMLVGMSGVGKSSLLMALKPGLQLATQVVSSAHGKGKHTTSVTTWYALNEQTALIDSPGVWEFGLWKVRPDQVLAAFPDLLPLTAQCRFGDCSHEHEPGCAIRESVARGEIAGARLDAYLRIVRTLPSAPDWQRKLSADSRKNP